MRIAIGALLLMHGLLHLIGLGAFPALTLTAAFVLLTAAAFRFADARTWWVPATAGVLLSQLLIVLQWREAWAGTLVNALLALAVTAAIGRFTFENRSNREAKGLLQRAPQGPAPVVTAAKVDLLPPPVRRWLHASGVVGRPRIRTVRLLQRGEMRMKPGGAWMPVEAEQYFDAEAPAFLWTVRTKMARVIPILGRDRYEAGHGHMRIEIAGLFPVANGRGPEIDQGTLLRFLAETVWFPSAALAPFIHWEPIDDNRARATMTFAGTSASADFTFDAQGRFMKLTAQRYYAPIGAAATLHTWEIPAHAWKRFDGVEIPSQGDAVWKLETGDLSYYRWRIADLELDVRKTFAELPPDAKVARSAAPLGFGGGARPLHR